MHKENLASKIRLNKYLAHAGLGNRRSCEILIKKGLVSVNSEVTFEPSLKVNINDEISYKGKIVKPEKKVYILINKPKKFIFDSENSKELTISHLIRNFPEKLSLGYLPKVFPIVELDKNDTGLMLISNDKELLKTYNDKSSFKKTVFILHLDKSLLKNDIASLQKLDEVHYLSDSKDNISVELKFKFISDLDEMFSNLGINILKKDCIIYDFLNKKNLPRGKWRFLKPTEIVKMKHLNY